jgi:hypothetical protein
MTNQSTTSIFNWYHEKEVRQELHSTPKQKLDDAVLLIEKVAYAKGLKEGLERLEKIACIIPNRYTTGPVIIKMLQTELNAAILKWKRDNNVD